MFKRTLGRSGIEVSALGLGCWAIGGPFWKDGRPAGWGEIDEAEAERALLRGVEMGATFLDTSDIYGCGASERLMGRVLQARRSELILSTKFGNTFVEETRQWLGRIAGPQAIRHSCDESLRRLRTDYIDLYFFHIGDYPIDQAVAVREVLEELVAAGKIRYYGWSTDDPARARVFAEGKHCTAIQHRLSLLDLNPEMLALCEEHGLASVNRSPLAMGLLTGKFTKESELSTDDVRRGWHGWNLQEGPQAERLERLEKIRGVLTRDGRTLAQGALGWIWAHHKLTIPIPGFKNVKQIEENVRALELGPLTAQQMQETDVLLGT